MPNDKVTRELSIEVKDHTFRSNAEYPHATDVFVSLNGYQWSGFTVYLRADLVVLRDAINQRLEEI